MKALCKQKEDQRIFWMKSCELSPLSVRCVGLRHLVFTELIDYNFCI